jgi:hypothetical protein
MPDSSGIITDHDVRLVAKVQGVTPTIPSPFKGMFWYDTTASTPGNTLATTLISSTYTVTTSDELIVASGGPYSVNLPVATGSGRLIWIKYMGTSSISVDSSGCTIDNEVTQRLSRPDCLMLADAYTSNWVIL